MRRRRPLLLLAPAAALGVIAVIVASRDRHPLLSREADLLDVRFWTGLTADPAGHFHPAWTTDATGVRQLRTATVEVTPR